jgi:glycerol-3-phosphate acyltransferase PlsY
MGLIIILLFSYLIGSIPTAVWLGRMVRGVDVRDFGSGNAGATNAFRVLGLKWGLVVMALDMGKGLLAVLVVSRLLTVGRPADPTLVSVLAGVAAVCGHIFPVTVGFRGGKGVGTSAGVMFALAPLATLTALVIWIIIVVLTRYVSLGSMIAALSLPLLMVAYRNLFGFELGRPLLIFSLLLALGVLISHRANIGRLIAGKENRLSLHHPASGRSSASGRKPQ